MGRYVRGTAGFTFKYHPDQDTNLERLASWAGFAPDDRTRSLAGQLFAPFGSPGARVIDAVSRGTSVCEAALPPFDLAVRVESAIYQVTDRCREVLAEIDATAPGPVFVADIGQLGVVLRRSQWSELASRIGRGADATNVDSIIAARDRALVDCDDELLPYLAASALLHAVENNLDELSMVDRATCRDTNLWSVAAETIGPSEPNASFEERALRVRVTALQQNRNDALGRATELLRERPTDRAMFRVALGVLLWRNEWARVEALASELLAHRQSDAMRAELLHYRGDARWSQLGRDSAREDASLAKQLGLDALQRALDESDERTESSFDE